MSNSVFFSWQSDTPSKAGRNFIELALNRAVGAINSELEIQEADRQESSPLIIEKDTKGIPGSPSIVETILGKIDRAICFVADLSFVAERSNGGGVPNPNVMIEYGYALKCLGEKRVIAVMNEASGAPSKENMPFDLAHKRFPITYNLPLDAGQDYRKEQLSSLSKIFEVAIRDVVDHHSAAQPDAPAPAFPAKIPVVGRARFGQPTSESEKRTLIGKTESSFNSKARPLLLDEGPAMYLRLFPTRPQNREWTRSELKRSEQGPAGLVLLPFQDVTSRFNAEDGCGWFSRSEEDADHVESNSAVIAFTTGEIWSVDTSWLQWWQGKIWLHVVAERFSQKLEDYASYLQTLGVTSPFCWIAGFEDIDVLVLDYEPPPGRVRIPGFDSVSLTTGFESSGVYTPRDSARDALRPFLETLCDKCAMNPPRHIVPNVTSGSGSV